MFRNGLIYLFLAWSLMLVGCASGRPASLQALTKATTETECSELVVLFDEKYKNADYVGYLDMYTKYKHCFRND